MFDYDLTALRFSDGSVVNLQPGAILIITGANNSGKSRALRDIAQLVSARDTTLDSASAGTAVVKGLSQRFKITDNEGLVSRMFADQLRENVTYQGWGDEQKNNFVAVASSFFGEPSQVIKPLLLSTCSSDGRFSYSADVNRVPRSQKSDHPAHLMDRDKSLELTISKIIKDAFGRDLILDLDGPTARFRIGNREPFKNKERESDANIGELMTKTETLAQQGDGLKGFTNIVLSTLVSPTPIVLIDEPEAYLHPPQARKLAKLLVEKTPKNTKLIVATHDYEFVRGLLEAGSDRAAIIRLRRAGDINQTSCLRNEDIRTLLSDNFLRASDALAALFHEVTILCEGFSDFVALRTMTEFFNTSQPPLDIMFLSCGTKSQLDKVAKSLRALRIPVVAATDCDAIDNLQLVQRLASAFEADGEKLSKLQQDIARAIDATFKDQTPAAVAGELERLVSAIKSSSEYKDGSQVPKKTRREIASLGKEPKRWSEVKKKGRAAFVDLGKEATAQFDQLVSIFAAAGLLINSRGELESLWPEGPSEKADWIEALMARSDLASATEFEELRNFSKALLAIARKSTQN